MFLKRDAHLDPHQHRPKDASHDGLHYICLNCRAFACQKNNSIICFGENAYRDLCTRDDVCESSLLFVRGKAEVL